MSVPLRLRYLSSKISLQMFFK
uniref:Uncharacterized protein n=1 Tax=Arundo donax TaxID=35708 RepID=A0A0A9GN81_ARUDO